MLIYHAIIFYISGIALFFAYSQQSISWLIVTTLLFFSTRLKPISIMFFICGFARIFLLDTFQPQIKYDEKTLIRANGIVQQTVFPSHLTSRKYTRFVVLICKIQLNDKSLKIQRKMVVALKNFPIVLHQGDYIELCGIIHSIPQARNPGEFDQQKYWRIQNVRHKIAIRLPQHIKILQHGSGFLYFLSKLRYTYCSNLLTLLEQKIGSVAIALILGEKSFLSSEIKQIFLLGGALHLLAISGFHIAIIASFLLKMYSYFSSKYFLNLFCVIVSLIFYAMLVGASTSVVRAVVIISIYLAAPILGRSKNALYSLGWSAFLLLLSNPYYLQSAGFQLSFMICFCIIWLMPQKDSSKHKIEQSLKVSAIATICSFPLAAYHFSSISPIALFSSVFLIPVLHICMMASFALLFSPFLILHPLITALAYSSYVLFLFCLQIFTYIPYHHIHVAPPYLGAISIFYICVWKIKSKNLPILFLLSLAIVLNNGRSFFAPQNMLVALDIGHGDAIFIKKKGKYYLYDCGSIRILPFLRYYNITNMEAIILSHTDIDHYRAILPILQNINVKQVICNTHFLKHSIAKEIRSFGTNIKIVEDGEQFDDFRFIYPGKNLMQDTSDNEHSLGAIVNIANKRILLLGDMENKALQHLLRQKLPIVDLMQIPHHGSHNKYTSKLIKSFRPKKAILSSKKGFPSQEILKIYEEKKVKILKTYEKGAIILYFD